MLTGIVTNKHSRLNFELSFHNQSNHCRAFKLSADPNYVENKKGLSMVDVLLLIQMEDEDGLIYTSNLRMSYFINKHNKPSAIYYQK